MSHCGDVRDIYPPEVHLFPPFPCTFAMISKLTWLKSSSKNNNTGKLWVICYGAATLSGFSAQLCHAFDPIFVYELNTQQKIHCKSPTFYWKGTQHQDFHCRNAFASTPDSFSPTFDLFCFLAWFVCILYSCQITLPSDLFHYNWLLSRLWKGE